MTSTDDQDEPKKRIKLTDGYIKAKCNAPEPGELNSRGRPLQERFFWDDELRGFGLVARAQSKSFVVQKDVKGRSVRVTIGRFPDWNTAMARKRARELIVEMDKGGNPNRRKREEAVRGVTLAEAMEWHHEAMRADDCSPRSIESMKYEVGLYLSDWLKRPLAEITRHDCANRHRRITEQHGKYAANRSMRFLRACHNTASDRLADTEALPPNPVSRRFPFNKERRRKEPILWSRLPAWAQAIDSLANPVRRDLQYFVLFTGLRREDACTVRWEHVNLTDEPIVLGKVEVPPGCIHRPKPKGGVDRAFTVPLSTPALEILKRRRRENVQLVPDDGGWAFPTRNMRGEVTCVQEMKEKPIEPFGKIPSPHRLRDTFVTAASEAGLARQEIKLLVNHTLPDSGEDVTDGYIRNSEEHLRGCIERVAAFLSARLWPKDKLRAVPRAEVG